jgi:hypothetical protein
VNQIEIEGKTVLLYPHQIKIVEESNHKVTVVKSYFKGFYWLIEAEFEGKTVFFQHESKITRSTDIFLSFPTETERVDV